MRSFTVKLFLSGICIALTLQLKAQPNTTTCNGSLGDPVINQDFGAGPNPGFSLGQNMTNMTFTTNNCPNDGEYTIANSLIGAGNCHPNTWQDVSADHTGNQNGYMMIINASYAPSIFFTQAATGPNGLCPNTTYEFSAYVLNLITLEASGPNVIEPDIAFAIESTTGLPLAYGHFNNIPNTPKGTLGWTKCSVFFTTPANVTDVVVKMNNLAPGGNGNDLILDDITFRACGPIIQAGFTSISGPTDQPHCLGSTAVYTLKAQVFGNNNPFYQWQANANGGGWLDMPNETANSLNVLFNNAAMGTYQYRLGVSNGSNSPACRVYSGTLTVNVVPLPVVPPIAPQTICEGSPLMLTASGGVNYIWSGPKLAPTIQNTLIINNITPANAGVYSVAAISPEGCTGPPTQVIVTVTPKVVAIVGANPPPICAGESVALSASGGTTYKWTPTAGLNNDNIANPIATPSQTTTYSVTVSGPTICTGDTKTVTVTVNQLPVANAGSDQKLFEGQSRKLNGTVKGDEISNIYWTPTTGLSDPKSLTPIATPTDNITYTLNVISKSCGSSTSSVYITVFKKITIPNAFSPNNDTINDSWNIDALIAFPESSVLIYNRYGQQVYQSTGYARPWDGTINGAPLPGGTYYYVIDLKNSTPKLAGWVLIVK